MRAVAFLLLTITMGPYCFSQRGKQKPVELIEWNALDCDNTYDPYRLITRITTLETDGDITLITVNFKENCCPTFDPVIEFNNGVLNLIPYTKRSDIMCACDCCFSIEFKLSGLPEQEYKVQFNGQAVEYSEEYYKTMVPSHDMYEGKEINRRNKYGFKEGVWMTFYPDSSIESIHQFPESVLYSEAYDIWAKRFHQNRKLAHFSRNDTIQVWFEDGTLKYEHIEYDVGDTSFTFKYRLHENRQLKEKSLQTSIPTIYRSKYNDCYEGRGARFPYVYKETYYENGQIEFLLGEDTTKKWYPDGQLKEISIDSKRIKYDQQGNITERAFYWDEPGHPCSMDLDHSLYVEYDQNGNVLKVRLSRDEATETGTAMGRHYYWKWNSEGVMIKSPEVWIEALPWARFAEIQVLK